MLDALDRLPAPMPERVRARVSPEVLDTINSATTVAQLDASLLMAIDEALFLELGEEAFVGFWRRFVHDAYTVPVLSKLVEGVMRLFGSEDAILRILPRTFGLVGRNLGVMSYQRHRGQRAVTLVLTEVPSASRVDYYGLATKASILGAIDLIGGESEVDVDLAGLADGIMRFEVRWADRAQSAQSAE